MNVQDPQLRSFDEEIEAILLDARALTSDLSDAQLNWRPDERRWSVGQCLDHITRTVQLYPAGIEQAISEAREREARGDRAYRRGRFARWFVKNMEPPPRMRIRTTRAAEPAAELRAAETLRVFEEAHRTLADLMVRADGASLQHGRMRSPFAPVLRFTLGDVFAINLAHARRHLWQARQVRTHSGFPGDAS